MYTVLLTLKALQLKRKKAQENFDDVPRESKTVKPASFSLFSLSKSKEREAV